MFKYRILINGNSMKNFGHITINIIVLFELILLRGHCCQCKDKINIENNEKESKM